MSKNINVKLFSFVMPILVDYGVMFRSIDVVMVTFFTL